MGNYADKLMRKYRSSVENIKEDLIEFARRSIKKSEVYLEQHMMDYEFLEMQGVDISDLRKDLAHIEKRVEAKKELLNQIYRIKDKKDIMNLRIKMLKTFGKTPILSKKKLKKIKDTAKDKEQKVKYVRWQKRQKEGQRVELLKFGGYIAGFDTKLKKRIGNLYPTKYISAKGKIISTNTTDLHELLKNKRTVSLEEFKRLKMRFSKKKNLRMDKR